MQIRSVIHIFSWLLAAISAFMLAPALLDWLGDYQETAGRFMQTAVICSFVAVGGILGTAKRGGVALSLRGAVLLTNLTWVSLCAVCAIPLEAAGLSYVDALFETVSGITTTGSTVISGLDDLSPGILLWRSILQWLGGLGIIVMAILLLPFLNSGGMQLFKLESSNRSEKPVARTSTLIRYLILTYLSLTMLCGVSYALAGMTGFDALNHAMTTIATGGYSTHDASFGHFDSPVIRGLGTLFMLAGALPFMAYVRAVSGRGLVGFRESQVITFAALVAGFIMVLSLGLWLTGQYGLLEGASHAAFNIVSVMTTTGFASADYALWGAAVVTFFFGLTVMGACSGSTSGAIKVYRFEILFIFVRAQLRSIYAPRQVRVPTYNGEPLEPDVPMSVLAFLGIYFATIGIGTVLLGMTGLDLITALTASVTALSNVGPGLGDTIGPSGNFAPLGDSAKAILMVIMLLGRLELFVVLVLLLPDFWRR